ncbi:MAG: SpoIIE family protein phosphatase [Acidimicrobiales bacterium]|nr:SpoIIE family protein phosphatase [Acidimicrobiales bacterium]
MATGPESTTADRLGDLQSVADVSLSRLGIDDLLGELLERVRAILKADTAAVLLLDRGANELVARAARGLEEEVRQGARVPFGQGFAGRVARLKQPLTIGQVDPTTTVNPILWAKGLRSMLGVPLLADEQVLGVLHVGRLDGRPFEDDDIELLLLAGERIAGALSARLLALEQATADILERALLPSKLPECPGVRFASRYVSGEDSAVGGDFYDAFILPSGDLWMSVGDVAGRGLSAAIAMGHARSALRASALIGQEPDEVLSLTDRHLQQFHPGTMVTAMCVVAAPPYDTFRISSAGHPPPVLARPGSESRFVELETNLPLNARRDAHRGSATFSVVPGGLVLCYTDGLVERRDERLDARLEELRTIVGAEDPERVCQRVMGRMVGLARPIDDIALVALQRTAEEACTGQDR